MIHAIVVPQDQGYKADVGAFYELRPRVDDLNNHSQKVGLNFGE
jgi:hypothetical protein